MQSFDTIRLMLLERVADAVIPRDVLKSVELKELYSAIKNQPQEDRAAYGQKINALKAELEAAIVTRENEAESVAISSIDITAPMDANANQPSLLPTVMKVS